MSQYSKSSRKNKFFKYIFSKNNIVLWNNKVSWIS